MAVIKCSLKRSPEVQDSNAAKLQNHSNSARIKTRLQHSIAHMNTLHGNFSMHLNMDAKNNQEHMSFFNKQAPTI
jgi:hypothetical protein